MRARLVLIPVAIAAALLAGCAGTATPGATATPTPTDNGIPALSATEILDKAKKAIADEASFEAKGSTKQDGSKLDVDEKVSGKNANVTITSPELTMELIKIGDNLLYIKADKLWETVLSVIPNGKPALALLTGKYVKVDTTNPRLAAVAKNFSSFSDLTNPDAMLKPEGTISKGDTKTINGTPAIGLVDSKNNSVLYIATVGKPLPLEVDNGDAAITFTYGATTEVKEPAASEVFDLASIMPAG